jgi:hypothetical protein
MSREIVRMKTTREPATDVNASKSPWDLRLSISEPGDEVSFWGCCQEMEEIEEDELSLMSF